MINYTNIIYIFLKKDLLEGQREGEREKDPSSTGPFPQMAAMASAELT